ncbi:sulfatase-like hydrolase/transferase [Rosistilla oblonga]|uniref:sulfatase-like hydrolase/transferase n=1 Tax=Rosistilla oblonga TaxID=2527990 RepID=UPI003A971D7F
MKSLLYRALLLLVTFGSTPLLSLASGADQPNFVFLISEDNSTHYLQLFDPHGAATPNIEALAASGLLFENAFSNAPVCSVARTTLITSCYGPRIGTQFHRRSQPAPMPEGLRMWPAYLRDAGYYTTNNSKKDYNAIEGPGVWDASSGKANWRGRKPGQPFFHKQSFGTTHESRLHFSGQSMEENPTNTDPATVFVAPYHPDTPTFRYTNAKYRDLMQQVDAEIGKVVDRLEADGLLEETFIFYFGDHGGVLPRGKGYAYDSGLHIPLVVRIPAKYQHLVDATRGSRSEGFVSFIDFGPTLLHLAGVEVPQGVDGKPFLGPGISAAELASRDEAFGYADRFDEKWDLVRTLRKGRYEYVRSFQPFNFDGLQNNYRYKSLAFQEWRDLFAAGELNAVQAQFFQPRSVEALYDLKSDPHETINLAGDPQYADVLMELRKQLGQRMRQMPDLSLFPESVLIDQAMDNPVAFGQRQQERIAAAMDVADLSLQPFLDAAPAIAKTLAAEDELLRYWGCIVCSCHGKQAASLADVLRRLAAGDASRLVRVRAAESLSLIAGEDPRPVIMQALRSTTSPLEAAEILNTVVMLQDGPTAFEFEITAASLASLKLTASDDAALRRLEYLDPNFQPIAKKKQPQGKAKKRP